MSEDIKLCKDLFRKHSKTYYYSTWIFPKEIRHRVYILYAFVRLADELVDNPISEPTTALHTFREHFTTCWEHGDTEERIISIFVRMAKELHFEKSWIDAFLDSMEMDLHKRCYDTQVELDQYIYGSAEVIGLMMCRIMGVGEEGFASARALGASMQLINFIRDIHEDRQRNRIYIPLEDLRSYHVEEKTWMYPTHTEEEKKQLLALLTFEIDKTILIQKQAEAGFHFLPKNCQLPVRLAAFTYNDIMLKIKKSPLVVFEKKISSTRRGIFLHLLTLLFAPGHGHDRT